VSPKGEGFNPSIQTIKSIFGGKKTLEVEGVVTEPSPDSNPRNNPRRRNPAPNTGHAEGVISTSEHIARVSEGNRPEAYIPLDKPNRAKMLLKQAQSFIGGVSSGTGDNALNSIATNVQSMVQMLSQFSSMLGALNQGLNQAEARGTVGATIQNVYNQQTFDMQSHFTIHETSGRPQAVADAVDRTQVTRIRNLQGVLNTV
jgi:SLT domain-containing protein